MDAELRTVEATGSTNDDAIAWGRSGAPHGSAIAARRQTTGRGRRGHTWISPKGGLYLSIILRPEADPQSFLALPAAAALGVLEGLCSLDAEGILLKWPNDIVGSLGGETYGKLGGILVETKQDLTSGQSWSVAGIGLNLVRPLSDSIHPERVHDGMAAPLLPAYLEDFLPDRSTASDDAFFRNLALHVRNAVVARVDGWAVHMDGSAEGPLAPLREEYEEALAFRRRAVAAISPSGGEVASGIFEGVDAWGRACVRGDDGVVRAFLPEEASLRPRVHA